MALVPMEFEDAVITDNSIATGVTAYKNGKNVFINFDGMSSMTLAANGYTTIGTTTFVPAIRIVFSLIDDDAVQGNKRTSLFCIINTSGQIQVYNNTTAYAARPRGSVSYIIP